MLDGKGNANCSMQVEYTNMEAVYLSHSSCATSLLVNLVFVRHSVQILDVDN